MKAKSRSRTSGPLPAQFERVRRIAPPRPTRKQADPLVDAELVSMRIDKVRRAIHANQVSFPSPAPTFEKHDRPDLQWKLAQLYFVRRWNCEGIGAKYGLIHQRVRQILNTWTQRAIETGYIQLIPPVQDVAASPAARVGTVLPVTGLPPFVPVHRPIMPSIPAAQWADTGATSEAATRV